MDLGVSLTGVAIGTIGLVFPPALIPSAAAMIPTLGALTVN